MLRALRSFPWRRRALLCAGLIAALQGVGVSAASDAASPTATGLSAKQTAGQHVIYSFRGITPPHDLVEQIMRGDAAGVILFKSNIDSLTQLRATTRELQRAAARSPVKLPLLILTDQEGGEVRRLPGAPALSEKQIGDSENPPVKASDAGRNAARDLERAGINVNLAPVLDVYRHPGDFDDRYGRSYSDSPQEVARLGADFIRAQQRQGVAATAKHFPGLGAATAEQNTDDAPVRLTQPLRTIRDVDELPYRAAIRAGVKLVMVSWATYTALDPHRPAGLSRAVVQNQLRRRLGFTGVTITDALEAGALRPYGGTGNRALLATRAGMDLLLCSGQHVDEGIAATDALAAALSRGSLDRPAFDAATQRIEALRGALRH